MEQRSKFAFFTIINALALFSVEAATLTWTGGAGDGQMNSIHNWSPAQAPVNGDVLIFPSGLAASVNNNVSPSPLVLGTPLSVLDAYTITGSTFAVPVGGATFTFGTNAATLNNAVTLNGALSLNSNTANNTLGGQLTGTGHPRNDCALKWLFDKS
jgi:hypothetical protein